EAPQRPDLSQTDLFSNMSADDFHSKVEQIVLEHEFGKELVPSAGPFREERYRIAKALQYMQSKGQRIDSYLQFFKKIDDEAVEAAANPRKMAPLRTDVLYFDQQLGLPPLYK